MALGQPSLDQLRIFLAVADEGSFNRAAQKLGRAISVVSYGIAQMEALLDVRLFDREGSRQPRLTDAGKALLAEARTVAGDVDALLAKVRSLHQGLEAELSLVIDVMVPGEATAKVLRAFQQRFPTVSLRLQVEALGGVAALVLDGRASIGIAGPVMIEDPQLDRQGVGCIELVPVAAPSHPLATMQRIAPGDSRNHLQLVLTDRSPLSAGREFSVISPRSWRLADLGAKHDLLREGLGWGNMPRHALAQDLASGALVELVLPERPGRDYALNAIWRRDAQPGPAGLWMLESFEKHLATCARLNGLREAPVSR